MRTSDISFRLRTWAEAIRNKRKDRYELLCDAADRLDEQEERIAIMTEYGNPSENDLTFPPADIELENDLHITQTNITPMQGGE